MATDTTQTLDSIIDILNRHQQRATYSAVAALLGQSPRLLMHKHPRAQQNSWIVSRSTGRPTGYTDADTHPQLTVNQAVLSTRDELVSWLAIQEQ
jgi:hypothetical protein